MFHEFDNIPPGLLDLEANQLADRLDSPSLFHLPGKRAPALFVSCLLHGNETTGWKVIRQILKKYRVHEGGMLPRALSLFIGNVHAAKAGVRHLPGQADFNRVWPGTEETDPEVSMTASIVEIMQKKGVFASVDIHNNTGINPHYGCINVINDASLTLATMFNRLVIYFIRPLGVQSMAFSKLCPAVTLECGKDGDIAGERHAFNFVDACLNISSMSEHSLNHIDMDLFHTVGIVKIRPEFSLSFSRKDVDLTLLPGIDKFNFSELVSGVKWGTCQDGAMPLIVTDEYGEDTTDRYFENRDGVIINRDTVMPSMLTLDEEVIRQDCLCYLMERFNHP